MTFGVCITSHSKQLPQRRVIQKRSITGLDHFFGIMMPAYSHVRLSKEIRLLTYVLEKVANDTATALTYINNEMVAMRTVVLQNRMALDFVLAAEGGTCALIGSKCCTYIPDTSEDITNLVSHIRKEVKKLEQPELFSLGKWATSWIGSIGTSIVQGIAYTLVYLLVIIMIILLLKNCCASATRRVEKVASIKDKEEAALPNDPPYDSSYSKVSF